VNRRRISEYTLVHAVEYAYGRYMPGGLHPVAFVFLELDPELVDFNIHPAKREARFRDLPGLHQLVTATLREYLSGFDLPGPGLRKERSFGHGGTETRKGEGSLDFPEVWRTADRGGAASVRFPVDQIARPSIQSAQIRSAEPVVSPGGSPIEPAAGAPAASGNTDGEPGPSVAEAQPLYRGQLFKLFLLVEYGSSLYIVDQHAAHERILFEQLKSAEPVAQELLMPVRLDLGSNAGRLIADRAELLQRLGIRVEKSDDGSYEITALPEALISIEEESLIQALLLEKGSMDELVDNVFSLAACRLAVKEGRELDALTAAELIRRAFQLENARCPHGRPIWFEITEQQLFREIGRT
jgi:DNA mismatch repair protein MutL